MSQPFSSEPFASREHAIAALTGKPPPPGPPPKFLELACFDIMTALEAVVAGASRMELCANRAVGGTTPKVADFMDIHIAIFGLPIYVMIRPRGGDFVYTAAEISRMSSDIITFKNAGYTGRGADGFVFGVLDANNKVDKEKNTALVRAAAGRPCTFHRAFDAIPEQDMEAQLEVLIGCGFKALLTSGGKGDAINNKDMLGKLVKAAGNRIRIIVGGGVRSSNLEALKETGATWFHSSAIVDGGEAPSPAEVKAMNEILAK